MMFFKKRNNKDTTPLKQEIFEDAIYNAKVLEVICIVEAITIIGLVIALILKGA